MKSGRNLILKRVTAYILLVAVSFFFAPKELIHDFLHHEDTADLITHNPSDQNVEKLHEHCDLDQYSVPPLFHETNHFSFSSSILLCIQSVEPTSSYHFSTSAFLFFRGPPEII